MKTKTKNTLKSIALSLSLIATSYVAVNNDYMSSKEYEVTLIDKFETVGYKGGVDFHGIFKLKDGTVFSDRLSIVDYRLLEINKSYVRELRPYDIKQSFVNNGFYFFGTVIVLSLTAISCIATIGRLFL